MAGGGARTLDLGLADGVVHDICSAVHPMAVASPFLREFDLPARGVDLLQPEVAYANPLDGGRAALAYRSLDRTADGLGVDGSAWRRLLGPLVDDPDGVLAVALGDHRQSAAAAGHGGRVRAAAARAGHLRLGGAVPRRGGRRAAHGRRRARDHPPAVAERRGHRAAARVPGARGRLARPARAAAGRSSTRCWPTCACTAGPSSPGRGWTARRTCHLRAPTCSTRHRGRRSGCSGDRLTDRVARGLVAFPRSRGAAAKVDLVLSGPVPWAHPEVALAGTVHLGGSRVQIAAAEAAVASGRHAERPTVLVSDPGVVDVSRVTHGRSAAVLGLRARPGRVDARRDAGRDRPGRAVRTGVPGPGRGLALHPGGAAGATTTPTSSAATSPAARCRCTACSRGLGSRGTRTSSCRRRGDARAPGCARRRPRPVRACTACPAGTPPAGRCGTASGSRRHRRSHPGTDRREGRRRHCSRRTLLALSGVEC